LDVYLFSYAEALAEVEKKESSSTTELLCNKSESEEE